MCRIAVGGWVRDYLRNTSEESARILRDIKFLKTPHSDTTPGAISVVPSEGAFPFTRAPGGRSAKGRKTLGKRVFPGAARIAWDYSSVSQQMVWGAPTAPPDPDRPKENTAALSPRSTTCGSR